LNREKRQKIINQLARVNKNRRFTVLDRSVVRDVARHLHMEISEARSIIHYLWALSEHPSRVELPHPTRTEGNLDGGARNHDFRGSGYDLDIDEDQKCDLSIHDNFDAEQSLPDNSGQCKLRPSGIPSARLHRNSQLNFDHQRSQSGGTKRTDCRSGGSLGATNWALKSAGGQKKPLGKRQRKIRRCLSPGNERNPQKSEHIIDGNIPRKGRRNLRTNRAIHHHRENHPELILKRGSYRCRSRKLRKPSAGDGIFSFTDLAEV